MIDLHAHILPGVDDGPADLQAARALGRAAVRAGTRMLVCTPHIDNTWNVDPYTVRAAVDALRADFAFEGIGLDLVPGGEVSLTRAAELDEDALRQVVLGQGDWILLESPHAPVGGELMERVTAELQVRGFRVLLAHPERSPVFLRDYERLERLVAGGARCSITGSSLTGRFGRPARALSRTMLADGLVHNIASDAHDAERRRPQLVAAVREAAGNSQLAWWLGEGVPGAILHGWELPERPEPPAGRSLLARVRQSLS